MKTATVMFNGSPGDESTSFSSGKSGVRSSNFLRLRAFSGFSPLTVYTSRRAGFFSLRPVTASTRALTGSALSLNFRRANTRLVQRCSLSSNTLFMVGLLGSAGGSLVECRRAGCRQALCGLSAAEAISFIEANLSGC